MPVDWKQPDALERLLAAVVAANDSKTLDYSKIAKFYGRGATYDSIEGKFRKARALARDLTAEAAGRESPTRVPSRRRSAPSTPAKRGRKAASEAGSPASLSKTVGGRVSKGAGKGKAGRKKGKGGVSEGEEEVEEAFGGGEEVKGEEGEEGPVVGVGVSDAEILGEEAEMAFEDGFDEVWQQTVGEQGEELSGGI